VAAPATATPPALCDSQLASTSVTSSTLPKTLSLEPELPEQHERQERQSSLHLAAPVGKIETPFSKAFDRGTNWALGDDGEGADRGPVGGFTRPTFQLDVADKVFGGVSTCGKMLWSWDLISPRLTGAGHW